MTSCRDWLPPWTITCWSCGKWFTQERSLRGRQAVVCGDRLCVFARRYWNKYGRWPPSKWFTRYAMLCARRYEAAPERLPLFAARTDVAPRPAPQAPK